MALRPWKGARATTGRLSQHPLYFHTPIADDMVDKGHWFSDNGKGCRATTGRLSSVNTAFASIFPLPISWPTASQPKDKAHPKPSRYLVAKGLPTLPAKTEKKVWSMDNSIWRNSFQILVLSGWQSRASQQPSRRTWWESSTNFRQSSCRRDSAKC